MLTEGTKIRQFCRCQGSHLLSIQILGVHLLLNHCIYRKVYDRITPEFNLFFSRGEGEFVERGLRVFIRVRGRGLKKFGARRRLEEREKES